MIRGLLLLPLLLLSACISFNEPPQTHYYLLEAQEAVSPTDLEMIGSINVQIIDIPESLDRQQLLLKDRANMVRIINSERWAEPLIDNIQSVVRNNLQQHYPNATISTGIWNNNREESSQLAITVNQFIGSLGGETVVELSWQLITAHQVVLQGRFLNKQSIGTSYQDYVAGLNRSLNDFCVELSSSIAGN